MSKSAARALLIAGAVLSVFGARWLINGSAPQASRAAQSPPPATLTLTGTIRDFRGWNETGGHKDFENTATTGTGHFYQIVKDQLGSDGKPVFRSSGVGVDSMGEDASGDPILTGKSYIQSRPGDKAANLNSGDTGIVNSASSFNQWYNDTPGVNMSKDITLKLNYDASNGTYVFDDRTDPSYMSLGGFFPINDALFGDTPGQSKNYGFTLELQTIFTYSAGDNQTFKFSGDDDVWVFIDNKLVIDLGGIHGRLDQTINLDRITGLVDKGQYTLAVFFAERHITSSNFRIETTLALKPVPKKRVTTWTESEPRE